MKSFAGKEIMKSICLDSGSVNGITNVKIALEWQDFKEVIFMNE
jgi:hypothetical protein